MNSNQEAQPELDLTHYLEVVLRRRWIIIASLLIVFISTALVTFTTKPLYQASTLLVIEKERSSGGAVFTNGSLIESSNDDYYQTQYKLLQSESLTQRVFEEQELDKTEDFGGPGGLGQFRNAIAISPVIRSRLVYVRAASHDPKLAARCANALAETFVRENLANQLFISKEVLQALQVNVGSTKSRQTYDALPAVVNNTLIQALKGEYAKLESQHAEMSQKFTPKYPAMAALKSNMTALQNRIQAETDKVVASLKTELSGQLRGNNVRVVDPAQAPGGPFKPRKAKALFLGFIAGLGIGLLIAFIVEAIDQSIRTQDDVENKLQQQFLGILPLAPQHAGPVYQSLLAKEVSLTSDAIRNLRTMIDFAGVSQKAKLMLVTSSIQGEGKTYIASNLAVAFSQLGERVLLVEGDLRRPQLYKNFSLSAEKGLSNFLAAGEDVSELETLLQTPAIPNLKALLCGPRPPNPSELLNTPRLGAFVSWAKSAFDRVIVDCTPLFPINDTLLWGRHVPAAVFIVRYGATRTPLIQSACQRLVAGGIKPLGVVVNAAKAGGLSYAPYGHYYQQYYHDYRHKESASQRA